MLDAGEPDEWVDLRCVLRAGYYEVRVEPERVVRVIEWLESDPRCEAETPTFDCQIVDPEYVVDW